MENDLVEEPHTPYGEEISDNEAKRLISLEKVRTSDEQIPYPNTGKTLSIPITSRDQTEQFILSISVGKIDLLKISNQLRTKTDNLPLVRLDTTNNPHKNPDGTIITGPHIHIYKQGHGIKYAYPLSDYIQTNLNDPIQILQDFMTYCTITKKPLIIKGADQ